MKNPIGYYFRRNRKAARWNDLAIFIGLLTGLVLCVGLILASVAILNLFSALSLWWAGCMATAYYYSTCR